jgi:hypothetical protein
MAGKRKAIDFEAKEAAIDANIKKLRAQKRGFLSVQREAKKEAAKQVKAILGNLTLSNLVKDPTSREAIFAQLSAGKLSRQQNNALAAMFPENFTAIKSTQGRKPKDTKQAKSVTSPTAGRVAAAKKRGRPSATKATKPEPSKASTSRPKSSRAAPPPLPKSFRQL